MEAMKRRGNQMPRNEENLMGKSSKANVARPTGTRTALSNISNIHKRPPLGGKKKDGSKVYEEQVPVNKLIHRVKSQSNLQNKSKKDVIEIHDNGGIEDVLNSMPMEEDINVVSAFSELKVEDIDEDDMGNPTLCAEYVKDIYNYMHKLEERLLPGDYMPKQTEIRKKMRSILIDWLIQVQCRFTLLQETLYLTVYIIDRFLDKHVVCKSELQLVGVTSMLLASKYEEMYAPEIGDFVYITDNAYSNAKIRSMEQKILRACDYDFSNPLCIHFLRRISKAGSVDPEQHTLAKYLMELTLIEYTFVTYLPSKIAAAALFLSIKLLDKDHKAPWTPTLRYYSEYSEEELQQIVGEMAALVVCIENSKFQAVRTKYSGNKFLKISRLSVLKEDWIRKLGSPYVKKILPDKE